MRPARALIDLSALRHNYRLAKSLSGCRALAVVKANAYGHGALECAAALDAEVDGFAVSAIEEALELRAAGHRQPIVLLEGWFEASELELICQHDLWPVIHHDGHLQDLGLGVRDAGELAALYGAAVEARYAAAREATAQG